MTNYPPRRERCERLKAALRQLEELEPQYMHGEAVDIVDLFASTDVGAILDAVPDDTPDEKLSDAFEVLIVPSVFVRCLVDYVRAGSPPV